MVIPEAEGPHTIDAGRASAPLPQDGSLGQSGAVGTDGINGADAAGASMFAIVADRAAGPAETMTADGATGSDAGEDRKEDVAVKRVAEETGSSAVYVPPPLIPHRGVMTDASGAPLVGLVSTIFALYDEPSGGIPVWVDIQAVQVGAVGGYTMLLGGTTELPVDLFATGETRWLGVQPDGEGEQPRVRLEARQATSPGGRPLSTADAVTIGSSSHRVSSSSGTTSPSAQPHAAGAIEPDAVKDGEAVSPSLIPLRGVMTDASGAPLVGLVSTIFALYEEPSGGIPVWVDIQAVQAGAVGEYAVLLGETTELPVDLFATGETRWLGVQPDGEGEQPRVRLEARHATALGGRPLSTADAVTIGSSSHRVSSSRGTTSPSALPYAAGDVIVDAPAPAGAMSADGATEPDAVEDRAAVSPPLIPHRGVMTDASGAPFVGLVSTIFALYEEPSGGIPVWVDIQAVQAGAVGEYAVLLGETTELPVDLFATGETRWLGVQPDGEGEQPRVRLEARHATALGGRPLSTADSTLHATLTADASVPRFSCVSPPSQIVPLFRAAPLCVRTRNRWTITP